ncbi:MAG: peptide deformylase [Nocardioides sp.]
MPEDLTDAFVSEFKHWREVRGRSQTNLAREMGFDRSYISKIETGGERATHTFASRAEDVLHAGGALLRAWRDSDIKKPSRAAARPERAVEAADATPSLVVEHDHARLSFNGTHYTATQRRVLHNAGSEPITQYLIRIAVDRYPGAPEKSNAHYRQHPLTWQELELRAVHGDRDPMRWTVRHDRDAFKELWLMFENDTGKFPLYPGESTVIEYTYAVSETKWGRWFQRAVRLPTKRLSVDLEFPTDFEPAVWGTETTLTASEVALKTAIRRTGRDGRSLFSWSTEDPPLHARYRLEWSFRNLPDGSAINDPAPEATSRLRPSEVMADVGVVQDGDPILSTPARRFELPADASEAEEVLAALWAARERIAGVHTFSKGMGLAAPQIGINRAACIVTTPAGEEIALLNPRIIAESGDTDTHYEGCLSFFDVRGRVPRPLTIEVEHHTPDGKPAISAFDQGTARLVAHEIDHLNGILYRQRMRPEDKPIPVAEYKGTGSNWRY